jgi:hypothetical protein
VCYTAELELPFATRVPVHNVKDVLSALQLGASRRTVAAHNLNAHSSRSHAVFIVTVGRKPPKDVNKPRATALYFVDLAGSEKAAQIGGVKEHGKSLRAVEILLVATTSCIIVSSFV